LQGGANRAVTDDRREGVEVMVAAGLHRQASLISFQNCVLLEDKKARPPSPLSPCQTVQNDVLMMR